MLHIYKRARNVNYLRVVTHYDILSWRTCSRFYFSHRTHLETNFFALATSCKINGLILLWIFSEVGWSDSDRFPSETKPRYTILVSVNQSAVRFIIRSCHSARVHISSLHARSRLSPPGSPREPLSSSPRLLHAHRFIYPHILLSLAGLHNCFKYIEKLLFGMVI